MEKVLQLFQALQLVGVKGMSPIAIIVELLENLICVVKGNCEAQSTGVPPELLNRVSELERGYSSLLEQNTALSEQVNSLKSTLQLLSGSVE